MRSPEELTEVFRAQGLKITPQRQSIFRALHGSTVHPTAEAVFDAVRSEMPAISLRTVYQTLNDLAAMGEIQAIDLGTGSTRFDPRTVHHHHLVCEVCGRVQDVDAELPGVTVPGAQTSGFTISTTEIVFRGRCRDCTAAHSPAGVDDRAATDPSVNEPQQEATRA